MQLAVIEAERKGTPKMTGAAVGKWKTRRPTVAMLMVKSTVGIPAKKKKRRQLIVQSAGDGRSERRRTKSRVVVTGISSLIPLSSPSPQGAAEVRRFQKETVPGAVVICHLQFHQLMRSVLQWVSLQAYHLLEVAWEASEVVFLEGFHHSILLVEELVEVSLK